MQKFHPIVITIISQFILSFTLSLNPINSLSMIKCRSPSYLNFSRDSVSFCYLYASSSFNDSPEARIQYQKDLVMSATNRKISSYSRVYTTRKVSNDANIFSDQTIPKNKKNISNSTETTKTLNVQPFQRLVYKDPESVENIKKFLIEIEQLGSMTPGYKIQETSDGTISDNTSSSSSSSVSSSSSTGAIDLNVSNMTANNIIINDSHNNDDNHTNNTIRTSMSINYNKNTNIRLAKLEKKSWKQSCRNYHHQHSSSSSPSPSSQDIIPTA